MNVGGVHDRPPDTLRAAKVSHYDTATGSAGRPRFRSPRARSGGGSREPGDPNFRVVEKSVFFPFPRGSRVRIRARESAARHRRNSPAVPNPKRGSRGSYTTSYCRIPGHAPASAAPQAQQGPASGAAVLPPAWACTANEDSSFSTSRCPQFGQAISSESFQTIFSNLWLHSRQRYSKMGIGRLLYGLTICPVATCGVGS